MNRTVRILATAGAAFVLGAAALTGCTSKSASSAQVVKIGFAAPLTGDNAIYGEGMRRAAQLAVDEANASADVKAKGITFELSAQDDMGDPKQAVNVANLIASDTKVVGVVGHFNSGCSIPAAPVYNKSNLAMVSVSSNPALTANGLPNVDRVVAKDDAQGAAAGKLVAGTLGFKKVAVVDDGTPYGQGLAAQFIKAYTAAGGTVVAEEHVSSNENDFNSLVLRIKPKAPEAIYFAGSVNQGTLLTKQTKQAGMKIPLIGGDMIYSADYIKNAGAASEGDVATALGLPLEQQPKGTEFLAKYKAKYNKSPEAYDSYAYDAANAIISAVLKVGTDHTAVMNAVRNGSIEGVTGTIAFDANGDNKTQVISQYRVTNGVWKQIQ
ncbi:MAG: branched-chain amino acid ABC transporter substrate-binding protein [Coriobacteriia bacterium]|nr:branched-chain amino acid ABC transporter substrate-binding protein [Coriobacteriia bacterium]